MKRLLMFVLVLSLGVGMMGPTALAVDNKVLSSITIEIPDTKDLKITLTNVMDGYVYNVGGYNGDESKLYYFFFSPDSTITLNKDLFSFPKEGWRVDSGYFWQDESRISEADIVTAGKAVIIDKNIYEIEYNENNKKGESIYLCFYPIDYLKEYQSTLLPIANLIKITAKPTASTVLVNGKNVAFDAYTINGNNYFKLRDLAHMLNGTEKQFEVSWDSTKNAISLMSSKPYTAVGGEMTGKGTGDKKPMPTSSKITLDGIEVQFTAYTIDGNNYFKLRDIGQAFNFGVTWDGAKNTIVIDTSVGYTPE